ncbi:MAG: hypothetical protein JJT99_15395 [Rhodobacteraceae bacterium]|nr:hypothetical protein [Paracoccaceae bacterium]
MKLENLGDAIEEVKEIIRKKSKISAQDLKSISREFDVNEAAIQAYFKRETGRSVFEYRLEKIRPLTRARQTAKALRISREKDYWQTEDELHLKTFVSVMGRKHFYIGTRASQVLLHDLIDVTSGDLVALSTAELQVNFRVLYDKLVAEYPHLEKWL